MGFLKLLGGLFAANVVLDQLGALEQERQERRTAAIDAEHQRHLADLRRWEREQQEAMDRYHAWSDRIQREQQESYDRMQREIGGGN